MSRGSRRAGGAAPARALARRRGERVAVEVVDTGIGIGPEHQTRIFEEFYQVRNNVATERSDGGIGLGLAVCESLVRANGGRISVKSELGKGSTFTIHLQTSGA